MKQEGFTLLEVLVSLVLLAIVSTTLLKVIIVNQGIISQAIDRDQTSLLLKKASYLAWQEGISEFSQKDGSFDNEPRYIWRAYSVDTELDGIFCHTVEIVSSKSGNVLASQQEYQWLGVN